MHIWEDLKVAILFVSIAWTDVLKKGAKKSLKKSQALKLKEICL